MIATLSLHGFKHYAFISPISRLKMIPRSLCDLFDLIVLGKDRMIFYAARMQIDP